MFLMQQTAYVVRHLFTPSAETQEQENVPNHVATLPFLVNLSIYFIF
jgi:hypothetical protein